MLFNYLPGREPVIFLRWSDVDFCICWACSTAWLSKHVTWNSVRLWSSSLLWCFVICVECISSQVEIQNQCEIFVSTLSLCLTWLELFGKYFVVIYLLSNEFECDPGLFNFDQKHILLIFIITSNICRVQQVSIFSFSYLQPVFLPLIFHCILLMRMLNLILLVQYCHELCKSFNLIYPGVCSGSLGEVPTNSSLILWSSDFLQIYCNRCSKAYNLP